MTLHHKIAMKMFCEMICIDLFEYLRSSVDKVDRDTNQHIPSSNPLVSFVSIDWNKFLKIFFFSPSKIAYFFCLFWHMYIIHKIISFVIKSFRASLIYSFKVQWATLRNKNVRFYEALLTILDCKLIFRRM